MPKKKKKGNPNILSWIVDPIKGFLSPLFDIGLDLVYNLIGYDTEAEKTAIKAAISTVSTKLTAILKEHSVVSIEDALTHRQEMIDIAEWWYGFIDPKMLVSSIVPFVSLTSWISHQYRKPEVAAMMQMGTDSYMMPFEFGYKPVLRRYFLKEWQPFIPEPYRLAIAAAKGLLTDKVYEDAMAENGLKPDWADVYRDQNYLALPSEAMLMLLRRGKIDENGFRQLGLLAPYNDSTMTKLLGLKEVIPPIADLILFAVREAYGDHTYEVQYDKFEQIAMMMGLSKEAAGWYWYAHWTRIPLDQAYANLWRGNWTEKEFERMLRIKDIHPDDRKAIIDVAYRPLSIREMGYAYDVGAITEKDIVRYRRMGGLHKDDAQKAATALVDYRLNAERGAIRREYLHLYGMEKITETEFTAALKGQKTPEEAIPLWIQRGELEKERKLKPDPSLVSRTISRGTAQWLYEHEVKDEAWLRETLVDLDTALDAIDYYIEQSKQRIEEKKEEPVEPKFRNLNLTQIKDLILLGEIDPAETIATLEAINYSPEDAAKLEQMLFADIVTDAEPTKLSRTDVSRMYDMRVWKPEQINDYFLKLNYSKDDAAWLTIWTRISVDLPDYKAMYGKGWINEEALITLIAETGLGTERATEFALTIVKAEQPARVQRERDLTKAEILKGWKNEVLTTQQAKGLLTDLGYDTAEADYILEINRVRIAGDPEGYYDMKKVTDKYKIMRKEKVTEIPETVIAQERLIAEQKRNIQKMREIGASEESIAAEVVKLQALEKALRMLLLAEKLEQP